MEFLSYCKERKFETSSIFLYLQVCLVAVRHPGKEEVAKITSQKLGSDIDHILKNFVLTIIDRQ